MNIVNNARLLVGLKTKVIKPSIYSLLFETEVGKKKFMHTCVSFTLEEATEDALEALKQESPSSKDEYYLSLKVTRSVDDLLGELEDLHISPREQDRSGMSSVKNILMREILENKDLDLLKKYESKLNKHEKQYINERFVSWGVLKKEEETVSVRSPRKH